LTQQGLHNPYEKFYGRMTPFMCARCKLIELDDVSFYSQSNSKVAQRALRESSEDSNKSDRENDALTKAIRTKEQRGCIRGVSSKLTWNEGFLEHKSNYQKRKIISTPQVDMKELKRHMRRKLLGYLQPIIESQGIQLPDIAGMMSEEKSHVIFDCLIK
jgi:hypothetical protein